MKDALDGLLERFSSFLDDNGWRYPDNVAADLLAACLGGQFLLFAGPSGTGKSTAAKALAYFFGGTDRTLRIDVEPAWQSITDLTGYYSGLAESFLPGPHLDTLTDLTAHDGTPLVVLEEANLAPVEAYLTGIMQDLSRLFTESLTISLHDKAEVKHDNQEVPRRLEISGFPRLMATINVDADAPAPANKVVGRACVVLLEPPANPDSASAIDGLFGSEVPVGEGATTVIGDPRAALAWHRSQGNHGVLTVALDAAVQRLADGIGRNTVSKRDEARALMYMAYYSLLAQQQPLGRDEATAAAEAADNALLHFALPTLPAADFKDAVKALREASPPTPLLADRLGRLDKRLAQDAFAPLDFWACLT